jgi:heptosyltransferase-3
MPSMLKDVIPPAEISRVLVIKLRHHGDVLLAAPTLTVLKHAAPHAEIDALVYQDTAPMLDGHPALSNLYCIDRTWKQQGIVAQAAAEWHLLQRLRARTYSLIVHLTEHQRGAWLTRLLAPRWSVAPKRPGRLWAGSFSHQTPRAPARRHTVEIDLDALRRIGIRPAEADKCVTLVPGATAAARVATLLAANQLIPGKFIHLHPASRWLFKCWPAASFAALCRALGEKGWPIVLTAAPDAAELALIAAIKQELALPIVDLSGQLTLKELAALTAQARLFVGVDSAPMHIAAAMGTPTVALFGPSGDIEWGPWRSQSRVVTSDRHPCRPCGLDGCGGGKLSECLAELPVERVLAACQELLA